MIDDLFKPKKLSKKLKKQWETRKRVDDLQNIILEAETEIKIIQEKCKHPFIDNGNMPNYGYTFSEEKICPLCKSIIYNYSTTYIYAPYLSVSGTIDISTNTNNTFISYDTSYFASYENIYINNLPDPTFYQTLVAGPNNNI